MGGKRGVCNVTSRAELLAAHLSSQQKEREEPEIRLRFEYVLSLLNCIHGYRQSFSIAASSHKCCCFLRVELH